MKRKTAIHEDLGRSDDARMGSERGFGLVFAAVFAVIGLWPLIAGEPIRAWALVLAAAFLVVAMAVPRLLKPLNVVWFRIGLALHHVVTPVVMGVLFYLTVTPTGLIMRALGKDPLNRRFDRDAKTYWIERDPPGPAPETMKNQF